MAGNIKSGKKAGITNKKKDPKYYAKIGAIGGKGSSGYEFAHGKITAQEAGRLGAHARTPESYRLAAAKAWETKRKKNAIK